LGALIFEGESLPRSKVGRAKLLSGDSKITTTMGIGRDNLFSSPLYGKSTQELDDSYLGIYLDWGEPNFSSFMFDMISIWNGTYRKGFISSWHGMSHLNPNRKKA